MEEWKAVPERTERGENTREMAFVKKIFSTFEYTKITHFRYTSIIKNLHNCLRKRGENASIYCC